MKYNNIINKSIYRSIDTKMCNFMVNFIQKLKTGMYMRDRMNVVLEHLGIFQVNILLFFVSFFKIIFLFFKTVVVKDTNELLLCIAYIFEISELSGTQSAAYRLCN